jgi:tetratricopeptide (TPR) repeat protein
VGYDPPEQFLKKVSEYLKGVNTLAALNEGVARNPNDPLIRYQLAQKYSDRSDIESSIVQFQKLLELDPSDKLGHNEEARYTIAMTAFLGTKDPSKVDEFLEKYPNSPMRRTALYALWKTFTRDKDGEKAKKYFTIYLEKNPRDAGLMNNYAWGCAEAGINLDHASAVAQQAVTLATTPGEQAMYLDTFAHVEFRRGNVRGAIDKEQEALNLLKEASPKERKAYEEALAKFKGGSAN